MRRISGRLGLALSGLTLVMALSGCATAYQAKGFTGGFSETLLAPDTIKVQNSGNGYTSAERASDFVILRAADKSMELGCNYFGVASEANGASVGSASIGSAGWGRGGAWGFSSTIPVVKPHTGLLVKCFHDQQPGMNLLDAHFVDQSVRSKYGLKPYVGNEAPTSVTPATPVAPEPAPMISSASPGASAPPASSDVAAMVMSAQRVSNQLGCGDVHSTGGATFQASCRTYSVVIDCGGSSCRPIRSVDN